MTPSKTVRVSTGWSMPAPDLSVGDLTGGATASRWFGAPATGGLALPDASPTARNLYAPRGVWLDDEGLIVTDTGNHRVLIWHDPNAASHSDADVILGQPDDTSEGAQAGGRGPANGMRLPTGIVVADGQLLIADAWNHRILIWDRVPSSSDTPPDRVIGQPNFDSIDENAGGAVHPDTMYWPFGIAVIEGDLWVADTGNRRVLAFAGIPGSGEAPVTILGQPDGEHRDENGGEIGPSSFRWPHDIARNGRHTYVADAGNHRLLAWHHDPGDNPDADVVFGQPDFVTAHELPYAAQSATTLRFPYSLTVNPSPSGRAPAFAVADTANNRVLWWHEAPTDPQPGADGVLGQLDMSGIGENRWDLVAPDTLCWPYGVHAHGDRLAIADSGNNRVVIWEWSP